MFDWISALLMIVGAVFMLIGGLGVLRLPDLYMRVSASTKASTLGVGLALLSLAVHFRELGTTSRSLATIAFVLITAPVAAHMISRAAYFVGVRLWEGTIADEMRDRYNVETNVLESISFEPDRPVRIEKPSEQGSHSTE
jgi:multicomponent Na+:H+ antiporter subunit G